MISLDMFTLEAVVGTLLRFAAMVVGLPIAYGLCGLLITAMFPHWLDFLVKGKGLRMDALSKGEPKMKHYDPDLVPSLMVTADKVTWPLLNVFVVVVGYYLTGSVVMVAAHIALLHFQRRKCPVSDNIGIGPFAYYKLHQGEVTTDWTGLPRYQALGGSLAFIKGIDAKVGIRNHLVKLNEKNNFAKQFPKLRTLKAGDAIAQITDDFNLSVLNSFWHPAFAFQMLSLTAPFTGPLLTVAILLAEPIFGTDLLVRIVTEVAMISAFDGILPLFDLAEITENREFFTTTSELGMTAFNNGVLYDSRHKSMFGTKMTHCPAREFVTAIWKSQPKFQEEKQEKTTSCPFAKAFCGEKRTSCPFAAFSGMRQRPGFLRRQSSCTTALSTPTA